MCGIAGWYRRGRRPVARETVVAQCNRIVHRGPDDSGDLIDGDLNATTDYRLVLAEILEKRCGAASVSDIFPGIGSGRPGVVNPRV